MRSGRRRRPLVVHRIDRDTSGIVVFAKNALAQQQLKDQFERREPERVYLAILHGHPVPPEGTWRDLLTWDPRALVQKPAHPRDPRAKEAVSLYRVRERFPLAALVEVRLDTGKRNQIRVQAARRGHPPAGARRLCDPVRAAGAARVAAVGPAPVGRPPPDVRSAPARRHARPDRSAA